MNTDIPFIVNPANEGVLLVPIACPIAISFAFTVTPVPAPIFKVLVVVISPPPVKPDPAVMLTPEWSMCSFATNPLKLSCTI